MKAYIQTIASTYTADNADRLVVNGPFVEVQRKRQGGEFETITVVGASNLAIVTLGVELQPATSELRSEQPQKEGNGHRPIKHYGHHVRRDLRVRACEPW